MWQILYIFLEYPSRSEGYKDTDEYIKKIVKILEDKTNHPFWVKHPYDKPKSLSKPGLLNPMLGKTHLE